ncbi:MAG: polysaccharide biosynthesis protein [Dehalococcoidia bacterium]|nr:polysaccharide biosynthesis protein [Dehalococcoidia bacterium]
MDQKGPQVSSLEDIDLSVLTGRKSIDINKQALARSIAGKTAMITGGGGSIGSSLADLLIGSGVSELTLFDNNEHSLFYLQQRLSEAARRIPIHLVLGDLRDRSKVRYILQRQRPQLVYHLGAYKHVPVAECNADEVAAVNILGSLNVVEEAISAGVERFVYPSTDKAVQPPSIYGATKRIVELLLQAIARERPDSTKIRAVRLVNTVGAQGGVIRVFAEQIGLGLPITVTDERMTRYWISMDEATCFVAQAAFTEGIKGIMMLDMGDAVKLTDVARRLWDLLGPEGRELEVRHVGMRPGERLHESLMYPYESRHKTPYSGIFDIRSQKGPTLSLADLLAAVESIRGLVGRHDCETVSRALFSLVEAENGERSKH